MTKRWLVTLAVLVIGAAAYAQPFVWPDAWTEHAGEEQYGGVYRSGQISGQRTFNPFVSAEVNIVSTISDGGGAALITRNYADWAEFIPYAAESFEVSEDGLVVDVVLRDGIFWSDGTPVTVEDYLFRYQAEIDEEVGSNAFTFWFVEGQLIELEATGENSLRFTFPAPDRTAFTQVALLPAPNHILGEVYREGGAEALTAEWGTEVDVSQTVWTGPFVPVQYVPDERIVFERNEFFGEWNVDERGNALPYLDGLNYAIADLDALLNLYIAGQIDQPSAPNLDQLGVINVAIQSGDIDATVIEAYSPQSGTTFYVFNWNRASDPFKQELFRSEDFRKAMSHLTDRDAIVDLVYGGAATPVVAPVPLVYPFWVNEDAPIFPYDPERALELLAGLGFTERNSEGVLVDEQGRALEFNLATNAGNPEREQTIQIIADTAAEYGVRVNAQALDFTLLVDQLSATGDDRPFDAILIGFGGGFAEWPFLDNILPCDANFHMWNLSGDCLTVEEGLVEEYMFAGRQTLDDDEAREIAFRLQEVYNELQPMIYTVSVNLNASWLNAIGGNIPMDIMSSLTGTRDIVLTFRR
jgi:peptide/nickel transport system substrate-binding protein